jgi:hypothetical protein
VGIQARKERCSRHFSADIIATIDAFFIFAYQLRHIYFDEEYLAGFTSTSIP